MGCSNSKVADAPGGSNDGSLDGAIVGTDVFVRPHKSYRLDTWKLGHILGTGAFSEVRDAAPMSGAGEMTAIKCIERASMDSDDESALLREVAILKEVFHPHIVNLLDFFHNDRHYFMVTEKMVGGELFDRIVEKQHYSESHARDLVKLLTHTVQHLHSKHIVHRDLKPGRWEQHPDAAHRSILLMRCCHRIPLQRICCSRTPRTMRTSRLQISGLRCSTIRGSHP